MVTLLLLVLACGQDDTDRKKKKGLEEVSLWTEEDHRPSLDHPFFDTVDLPEMSLYAQRVETGQPRPTLGERGAFPVGNGRVFTWLGLADPFNTMHRMVGPTYDMGSRAFTDLSHGLIISGQRLPYESEWVGRLRGTPITVTRADTVDFSLFTVDFAPLPADGEPAAALIRYVLVSARRTSPIHVAQDSGRSLSMLDGALFDFGPDRVLAIGAMEGDFDAAYSAWALDLGTMEEGAHHTSAVVYATGRDIEQAQEVLAEIRSRPAEEWLYETLDHWEAVNDRGLQLEVADPRIGDLHDGLRMAVLAQTSGHGGIASMSRDNLVSSQRLLGPVRFLLRSGLVDEAETALDYLWSCHVGLGDYQAECASGLDPSLVVAEPPAWDELGDFRYELAAAGPSYSVIANVDLARWRQDLTVASERWAYLRRGVVAQGLSQQWMLPFSGQESFLSAMETTLGYPVDFDWQDLAWSGHSSWAYIGAAGALAGLAEDGAFGDPAALYELSDQARAGIESALLLEDGTHAPFQVHTATELVDAPLLEARPYEDVSLLSIWLGGLQPRDAVALATLRALQASAGRGDGTVHTASEEPVVGFDGAEGYAAGEIPGLYLSVTTSLGDFESGAAFDALHTYADPAGLYAEGIGYGSFEALHGLYDTDGFGGDVVARARPWESGVAGDAMLQYLLGVEPREGGLAISPHLPDGLPWMNARRVRVGPHTVDLEMIGDDTGRRVTVINTGDAPVVVQVDLPLPEGVRDVITDATARFRKAAGGERRVVFDEVTIKPGKERGFAAIW